MCEKHVGQCFVPWGLCTGYPATRGRICSKGNPENQAQCDFSFFFYLLLVASLRFSLVYLCVHFVFSTAALHFLVRWISRLIALCSKGAHIPSLHLFVRKTLNLDQFFLVHWQIKTSFSLMIMGSYTSENNCSCQWRCESTGKVQH